MSSFLQKLKGKGIVPDGGDKSADHGQAPAKSEVPSGVTQLPVDVYQDEREIIIYAQIPGAEVKDLDVSIEGDNDVITVQGTSHRPEGLVGATGVESDVAIHSGGGERKVFTLEECVWGKFFRQIILPQEVDAAAAQAKVKDGVLVLHLPLKGHTSNKIRMQVEKLESPG
jgi:HSP20 family protein